MTEAIDMDTQAIVPGDRLLPLEGSRNFRDLGGYPAADGRQVRWGMLYRSGSLAGLTEAGHAHFATLGIRSLCDLRTTAEQVHEPYDWCAPAGISYWSRDYQTSFGELRSVMARELPSAESARAAMMTGYRELPYEQAPAYREIFRLLAAGALPLVLNCSAGKDRAGTAAALVLSALGVPRETVIEDYALSDKLVDFRAAFRDGGEGTSLLTRLPDGVITAIFSSDPAYISVALDAIAARSGSLEAYLHDELGVDADALATIRRTLLA